MSPDISVELNYRGVTHSSASHFMRSKSIVSGSASASDLDQIHHSIIIIALTASSFRGACHDRGLFCRARRVPQGFQTKNHLRKLVPRKLSLSKMSSGLTLSAKALYVGEVVTWAAAKLPD
jgi:hypothetical protein